MLESIPALIGQEAGIDSGQAATSSQSSPVFICIIFPFRIATAVSSDVKSQRITQVTGNKRTFSQKLHFAVEALLHQMVDLADERNSEAPNITQNTSLTCCSWKNPKLCF